MFNLTLLFIVLKAVNVPIKVLKSLTMLRIRISVSIMLKIKVSY